MPLEAPAHINFSGTEVRTDAKGKQYGVYVIQCKARDGNQWACEKRYSEFDELRKALLKDKCDKVKQLESLQHGKGKFPKKGGKSVDPEVMKTRKEGLNVWLNSVMKFYGENLNVCAFFKQVAAIKRDVGLAAPPEGVPPPVEPVRPWPALPLLPGQCCLPPTVCVAHSGAGTCRGRHVHCVNTSLSLRGGLWCRSSS
eukprot:COSAG02_NODE_16517_length_1077_cov_1.488753_2_plen_198_part_00